MSNDDRYTIRRPQPGRPTDRRVDQRFLAVRPELSGLEPFSEGQDIDLVEEFERVVGNLRADVVYADPDLGAEMRNLAETLPEKAQQVDAALQGVAEQIAGLQGAAAGAVPYEGFGSFPDAGSFNGLSAWDTSTGVVYISQAGSWTPVTTVLRPEDVQEVQALAAQADTKADSASDLAREAQGRAQGTPFAMFGLGARILAATEGFPATRYAVQASQALDLGELDNDQRGWAANWQITRPSGSTNHEDAVAENARAIMYGGAGGVWAGVDLVGWMRQQVRGIVTLTNGSTIVTAQPGTAGFNTPDDVDADGNIINPNRVWPADAVYLMADEATPHAPFDSNGYRTYLNAYLIASVDSATQITLQTPWQGPTTTTGRIYRTINPGSAQTGRRGGHGREIDILNTTGWDAREHVGHEWNGLSIVAAGDTVSAYGLSIYGAAGGTAAGLYNGLLFKDNGVRNSALAFHNIKPRAILDVTDAFAGGMFADIKSGIPLYWRTSGAGAGMTSDGDNLVTQLGPAGAYWRNNAGSAILMQLGSNGTLDLPAAGAAINLSGAVSVARSGNRLAVNGQIVPQQSASVARLDPATATAQATAQKLNEVLDALGVV